MAMPPFTELAREWVQNGQVQAWLARVLEDLGGEHPVPALPPCGLCDALVLVLIESLKARDTALCTNKAVAFYAWLYNLLGGAGEKLVTPSSIDKNAAGCLLSAATTGCQRFNKTAMSKQRYVVNRATSAAARERTTAMLNSLLDLAGERRLLDALRARMRGEKSHSRKRKALAIAAEGDAVDETPPSEVVQLPEVTLPPPYPPPYAPPYPPPYPRPYLRPCPPFISSPPTSFPTPYHHPHPPTPPFL